MWIVSKQVITFAEVGAISNKCKMQVNFKYPMTQSTYIELLVRKAGIKAIDFRMQLCQTCTKEVTLLQTPIFGVLKGQSFTKR